MSGLRSVSTVPPVARDWTKDISRQDMEAIASAEREIAQNDAKNQTGAEEGKDEPARARTQCGELKVHQSLGYDSDDEITAYRSQEIPLAGTGNRSTPQRQRRAEVDQEMKFVADGVPEEA